MKNAQEIKVKVTETSGATFTSYNFETTVQKLIDGGHVITDEQVQALLNGERVTLYTYNLVGTRTAKTLKAIF
jgi:hypothetical protein